MSKKTFLFLFVFFYALTACTNSSETGTATATIQPPPTTMPATQTSSPPPSIEPEVTIEETTAPTDIFVYQEEDIVWAYYPDGTNQPLPITESVVHHAYASQTGQFAYAAFSPDQMTQSVYLQPSLEQAGTNILRVELGGHPMASSHRGVTGLSFSPDNRFLAVTTWYQLFWYDIEADSWESIDFPKPTVDDGVGGVFAYLTPYFSPDNQYIVMETALWEGRQELLVNLLTKDMTYNQMYGYGQIHRWLGFLTDGQLIKFTQILTETEFVATFDVLPSATSEPIATLPFSWPMLGVGKEVFGLTNGQNIYVLFREHTEQGYLYQLLQWYFDTGEVTTLYEGEHEQVYTPFIQSNSQGEALFYLQYQDGYDLLDIDQQTIRPIIQFE